MAITIQSNDWDDNDTVLQVLLSSIELFPFLKTVFVLVGQSATHWMWGWVENNLQGVSTSETVLSSGCERRLSLWAIPVGRLQDESTVLEHS